MKNRNPIAGNSWKYNTPKVMPNKKELYLRRADKKEMHKSLSTL